MKPTKINFKSEGFILVLVLGAAFLNGLLYVFLVPPWQHYDEPNHFEYVSQIAATNEIPQRGDQSVELRFEMLSSMLENDFYRGLRSPEKDDLSGAPLGFGYSQLGEPPLYYLYAGLPVRVLSSSGITNQLYAVRLASLSLFLLTVLSAWGITRELTAPGSRLRWFFPLTLALLPGVVDMMTAVNSDVGAAAVFSLFLWGSIRLICRGFGVIDFILTVFAAALCLFTKSSVYIAAPLLGPVLLFTLLRGSRRKLAWGLVVIGVVAAGLVSVTFGDAAYWYRSTSQRSFTRTSTGTEPVGAYSLQLETGSGVTPAWLFPIGQPIPLEDAKRLSGGRVTLGVWMWTENESASPFEVKTPVLHTEKDRVFESVEIDATPRFFSFWADVPKENLRIWVSIDPEPKENLKIYYDGFVLAAGEYPGEGSPTFADESAQVGTWNGQRFENLLRNPSIEQGWPKIRNLVDAYGTEVLPDHTRPSFLVTSFLDVRGAWWLYQLTAENLLETFWGKFGWGNVDLAGGRLYGLLSWVTILGGGGAAVWVVRKRPHVPWDAVFLMGLVFAGIWGSVLVRSSIYVMVARVFIPAARSASGALIPTVAVLSLGWYQGILSIKKRIGLSIPVQIVVYLAGLLVLNVTSVLTIIQYYQDI